MKNFLLIVSFITITSVNTFSQENFEYPLGDSLKQHWSQTGPVYIGPYNHILITNPSLTFPSYSGSDLGYSAMLDTVDYESLRKSFDFFGTSSGSIYTSFIVRVGAARPGGGRFINIGGAQLNYYNYNSLGGVFVKESAGKLAFGIAKHNETPVYTPAIYNRATNYLVIYKYTFVQGATNNDSLSLFVFSDECPYIEPAPNLSISPSGNDFPSMGSVWLYQKANFSNSPRLKIDGIAMENQWNNTLLPIELNSFNASVNNTDVNLKWTTNSETNNSGFDIERKDARHKTQDVWSKVGFVSGNGTTNSTNNYSYSDIGLNSGSYSYRLKQKDFNGNFEYFNLSQEVSIGIPDKHKLSQNFPNPFNPVTSILYKLPKQEYVSLKVFDALGQEVSTLVNEGQPAGTYSVDWNAEALSSGIYFYTIQAGDFVETRRMILLK